MIRVLGLFFMVITLCAFNNVKGKAAPSPAAPAVPVQSAVNPTEDLMKLRDPFKRPEFAAPDRKPKSPLENYAVSEFKMVAVSTGPKKLRAILAAPDGKNYFVAERMRIGQRNGVITRITTEAIYVREKIVDLLGKEENLDSILHLKDESQFQIEQKQEAEVQKASVNPNPAPEAGRPNVPIPDIANGPQATMALPATPENGAQTGIVDITPQAAAGMANPPGIQNPFPVQTGNPLPNANMTVPSSTMPQMPMALPGNVMSNPNYMRPAAPQNGQTNNGK